MADTVVLVVDDAKDRVNDAMGDEIRVWRNRRGLSRAVLSAKANEFNPDIPLTPTQIERLENNRRHISLSQLFAISWALEVDPQQIVEDAIKATGGIDAFRGGAADE